MEDFRRETNGKLKQYRDEYIKRLETVLPAGRNRKSRNSMTSDNFPRQSISAIDSKFKEFVYELFIKPGDNLGQTTSVQQFCREFGMDADFLMGLRDLNERQEYMSSCINKQIENQMFSEGSSGNRGAKTNTHKRTVKNWMKLNTKHKFLETKIQEAFMQALNEEGNQEKIDNFVKDFNSEKEKTPSKSPKLKLNKLAENDGQKIELVSVDWGQQSEIKLKDKVNQMKAQLRDVNYMRRLGRERYITKEEYMLVAYSSIMRTLNQHKQYTMDRQTILKKYLEREIPLTQAEMKFILNTSPLITKSLNKGKIKTALENLDPDYLHSIEIRIADQVLNNFTNAIDEIKKSRKVFKKSTLHNILNKLHTHDKEYMGNTSYQHSPSTKTPFSNEDQQKTNLIQKYSGGYDTLKKIQDTSNRAKENVKTLSRSVSKKSMGGQNKTARSNKISKAVSMAQLRRQSKVSNTNLTKNNNFVTESEVTMKRRRDFLIRSLQMAAVRDNFEWVVAENYPPFSSEEINVPDKAGIIPLYYAIRNQNQEFCQYLLKNGSDVNKVCERGETSLHMAFKTNNHTIIMACLMKNPDLNVVCNKGFTPLAHGKVSTLKAFGLMNGVPRSTPNQPRFFDNNRMLAAMNKVIPEQASIS